MMIKKRVPELLIIVVMMLNLQLAAQEVFPDGTLIPEWFRQTAPTNINKLGKSYRLTDNGLARDSTVVQTKKLQAVIDKAFNNGGGVIVVPKIRMQIMAVMSI